MIAQPDLAWKGLGGRPIDEGDFLELDVSHGKIVAAAHDDLVRGGINPGHVPRTGFGEVAKAAALTHRVQSGPPVRAEVPSGRVRDRTPSHRQAPCQVSGGLAARDEADLLALGLVRDGQAELACVLAHLGLGHPAKRKDDARKPLAVQVVEHVRLALRRIDRRVKLWTGRAMNDPRVMSGGEPVKPELEHPPKHQVETDEGVAPQARIRRPTRQVRLVERLDHTLAELQLQVPAVIRNVEDGRYAGADERKVHFADDLAASMRASDELSRIFMKWVEALCVKQDLEVPWEVPPPLDIAGRTELDLDAEDITTVIWTAGFRPDYGWVRIPVFDSMGFPIQTEGRSAVPGLYFMGVHFQRKAQSAVLYGVGEDAEQVANHIVEKRS